MSGWIYLAGYIQLDMPGWIYSPRFIRPDISDQIYLAVYISGRKYLEISINMKQIIVIKRWKNRRSSKVQTLRVSDGFYSQIVVVSKIG